MKRWTKHMRKLIKRYRILEKFRAKRDGVWGKTPDKLCSECTGPLDCICLANERANELITLYANGNTEKKR